MQHTICNTTSKYFKKITKNTSSKDTSYLQNIASKCVASPQFNKILELKQTQLSYNLKIYKPNKDRHLEIPDVSNPSYTGHHYLINRFTSKEILENINRYLHKITIAKLLYNTFNKDLLFIYSNPKDKINIKLLSNMIIKRVLFFIILHNTEHTGGTGGTGGTGNVNMVGGQLYNFPTKICIFLPDHKKKINDELEATMHFKPVHVNSALTNGYEVVVYRKEELLKSIFHELIHYYNMDIKYNFPIPSYVYEYLYKNHNIDPTNTYLLSECITEALANILNIAYTYTSKYEYHIMNELQFSILQVSKILRVCKYNTWQEFTLQAPHTSNPAKYFKQESCIFSYYILKLYILLNIKKKKSF
jgi:hypothetical protein